MTISKEERAELRELTKAADGEWRVLSPGELVFANDATNWAGSTEREEYTVLAIAAVNAAPKLLASLDAADERIAELEKDCGIYQDANIRLTKEFEQERATLTRKSRALKHEIRKLHRAREQDWEAGKRWRKEFLEFSERLLSERREAERRIAELEAAAQWRPMDTAPRDGTWILVLLSPDLQGKADYSAASILSFRHDPFADYWRNVHWDKWNDGAGYGWLPIPALPEGGAK